MFGRHHHEPVGHEDGVGEAFESIWSFGIRSQRENLGWQLRQIEEMYFYAKGFVARFDTRGNLALGIALHSAVTGL